jgi:hypothetical protein
VSGSRRAARRWCLPPILLAAAALAACGSSGDETATEEPSTTSAPTPTSEPPFVQPAPVGGMLATIEVSRLFSLNRELALGLQNVGEQPVRVVEIQLETPLFETVPLAREVVLLPPDSREFDLPVPYGEARCGGEPADDDFTAVVVLDDGTELRLEAPERHAGGIGRLQARECAAVAVLEQVDLRFGDEWTQDGRAVTGELVLEQRRPGPSVAVDEMSGTVIFGLEVDREPPILRVTDDEPADRVPVVVSAERCDPHALIEAKKAFVFVAWVIVDGAEAIPVEVQPMGPARAALDALLATCLD